MNVHMQEGLPVPPDYVGHDDCCRRRRSVGGGAVAVCRQVLDPAYCATFWYLYDLYEAVLESHVISASSETLSIVNRNIT